MKTKLLLVLTLWAGASTLVFAQPQLSMGVTGGTQVIPTHGKTFLPLLGASAWFKAGNLLFLSGEYLRYEAVDRYPAASAGFTIVRSFQQNSRTQRLSFGLHYPVKNHKTSLALLGINAGQSWDKRFYNVYTLPLEPPYTHLNVTDQARRAVLFVSLTALGQNQKLPFYLQTRFGYSFNKMSSWSLVESKSFWQVLAGVHLKIL